MTDYGKASQYAAEHPDASRRVTIRCPWQRCEVGRLQVTSSGAVLTIMLRGAPREPLPVPENAPTYDVSRLPLSLIRDLRVSHAKGSRNFCYAWGDPMPDLTWTLICRCGSGVVLTGELKEALARSSESGPAITVVYERHPR